MSLPQEHFNQLLSQLSQKTGFELPQDQSTCTLVDNSGEIAVVMELPEGSDFLVCHRLLTQWSQAPEIRNARAVQLLALNGAPEKLKGAWFCTDPEGSGIHLMTGTSITDLDGETFENLLLNFVDLANTLAQELNEEEQELAANIQMTGLQP